MSRINENTTETYTLRNVIERECDLYSTEYNWFNHVCMKMDNMNDLFESVCNDYIHCDNEHLNANANDSIPNVIHGVWRDRLCRIEADSSDLLSLLDLICKNTDKLKMTIEKMNRQRNEKLVGNKN